MKRRNFLKLLGLGFASVPTLSNAALLGTDEKVVSEVPRSGELKIVSTGIVGSWLPDFEYEIQLDGVSLADEDRSIYIVVHPETFEPVRCERLTLTENTRIFIKAQNGLFTAFYPEWDEDNGNFKEISIEFESNGNLYWNTKTETFSGDATNAKMSVFSGDRLISDSEWTRDT